MNHKLEIYDMVDVLLISPPFKGLLREPIGLYYLAGVLKANGVSTVLIDFNIELPTRRSFRRYLKKLKPKIVGVTSYTFNFSVAKKIIEEIKLTEHKIVTVMGGFHASALPEEILNNTPALDFVVIGEGEFTFLELCRRILNGEQVNDIRGIAFRGEQVIVNSSRELIKNIDILPVPNRELLPFNKYPVATVQTSRGCPFGCIFCNINSFYGRRIRLRDPKKVIEECSTLIGRYGREKIYFFGDSFTFSSNWVEEFCDELLLRGLKFSWGCETRVDKVSLKLLRSMRKAGCSEIHYGIDYGDDKILRNLGKDTSISDIKDAVVWAKRAGLFVGAFFIFNVPGENEETMENTFTLIQRTPIDSIEINLLTPYPGTPIWLNPNNFDMRITDYNFDHYTTKKYVMENTNFPRRKFVPAFKSLLRRLNLIQTQNHYPEIYDFLKDDIKLRVWK